MANATSTQQGFAERGLRQTSLSRLNQLSPHILPEENLLSFLALHAPKLKDWQREVLEIVRRMAQYFYPQRQTKLMNEGCATFVHYEIMNRLVRGGPN